jgi:predicted dehydrogenase
VPREAYTQVLPPIDKSEFRRSRIVKDFHRKALAMILGAATILQAHAQKPTPEAKPLRIGIVGLVHGHAGGMFENALHRKDVTIVGVVESDTSVVRLYRERFRLPASLFFSSLEEFLATAKPEAVGAFSSTLDHRRIVEACSKRGVHVMMEKPMAVSYADALAIRRSAEEGKIQVLVNYETTWYPTTAELRKMAKSGVLGPIRKLVAHDGHQGPKEIGCGKEFLDWLTDPVLNGAGALMDFGCYGANLFTCLMNNQRPLTVTAVTQQIKPDVYPKVDDEATIVVTYPKAQGIIQASWNWPYSRKDLEVYGTAGSAIATGRETLRVRMGDASEKSHASGAVAAPENDPLTYLAAVVRGRVKPSGLSSLENNLIVCEILDAARRSAATGLTITLPLPE